MGLILLFWGLLLTPILFTAYWVYRRLSHKSHLLATVSTLLVLGTATLLWPIPMHGGFTVLAEVWFSEWQSHQRERQWTQTKRKKQSFQQKLAQRFSGALDYERGAHLSDTWIELIIESGVPAWLDENSQLIWSDAIPLVTGSGGPNLDSAKQQCQQLTPAGKWALATEAEHALRWQNGAHRVFDKPPNSILSYIADDDLGTEFPTRSLRNLSGDNFTTPRRAPLAIYCVARTSKTPLAGYSKKDLSLDLWNRYQISKLAH